MILNMCVDPVSHCFCQFFLGVDIEVLSQHRLQQFWKFHSMFKYPWYFLTKQFFVFHKFLISSHFNFVRNFTIVHCSMHNYISASLISIKQIIVHISSKQLKQLVIYPYISHCYQTSAFVSLFGSQINHLYQSYFNFQCFS